MKENLDILVKALPEAPGVYQYFNIEGELLYIGKAKNLKKRVSSYFTKEQFGKTLVLVNKISDIKFIVVDSEYEALILENNLIKKYRPPYNVMLKDDKTYPWLCIKNERFPRVFSTRRKINDGSQYFGPYPVVKTINTLLDMIQKLYPLRYCNLNLDEQNIAKHKYRPCLNYHIKRCKAPCVEKQNEDDYNKHIGEIKKILKGHIGEVIGHLKEKMMAFADLLDFESADIIKNNIALLEGYQAKSVVFSNSLKDIDVISIKKDEQETIYYVNYMKIVDGAVVLVQTIEMKPKLDEDITYLLELSIVNFRELFQSNAKEIIVPIEVNIHINNTKFTIPAIGEKQKLLELSERNIKYYILDKYKHENIIDPDKHKNRLMEQMKKDLSLAEQPLRIDCFDNSNIQGEYPVAAMTVAINGKICKKEYRHFNIRSVEGANDFATMEEVLERHYGRLIKEEKPLPQLVIVDGGKGQVSSAVKVLKKLQIFEKVGLIGIAERLEEIYKPYDNVPLYLDKRSETLKFIQQLRDEAHRFGISHYRKRHEKGLVKTTLSDIKGIGKNTAMKLLVAFHSVNNIKTKTIEELATVVGKHRARIVHEAISSL